MCVHSFCICVCVYIRARTLVSVFDKQEINWKKNQVCVCEVTAAVIGFQFRLLEITVPLTVGAEKQLPGSPFEL